MQLSCGLSEQLRATADRSQSRRRRRPTRSSRGLSADEGFGRSTLAAVHTVGQALVKTAAVQCVGKHKVTASAAAVLFGLTTDSNSANLTALAGATLRQFARLPLHSDRSPCSRTVAATAAPNPVVLATCTVHGTVHGTLHGTVARPPKFEVAVGAAGSDFICSHNMGALACGTPGPQRDRRGGR